LIVDDSQRSEAVKIVPEFLSSRWKVGVGLTLLVVSLTVAAWDLSTSPAIAGRAAQPVATDESTYTPQQREILSPAERLLAWLQEESTVVVDEHRGRVQPEAELRIGTSECGRVVVWYRAIFSDANQRFVGQVTDVEIEELRYSFEHDAIEDVDQFCSDLRRLKPGVMVFVLYSAFPHLFICDAEEGGNLPPAPDDEGPAVVPRAVPMPRDTTGRWIQDDELKGRILNLLISMSRPGSSLLPIVQGVLDESRDWKVLRRDDPEPSA
jgi:hypothetical protein